MFERFKKTTDNLQILINNAGFNMFKGVAETSQRNGTALCRWTCAAFF